MKLQLLFNTVTKDFIGFGATGQDQILNSNILVKELEIEEEKFNLARYTWKGNYDEGELIDLNLIKKPIISEYVIESKNYEIFWRNNSLDEIMLLILSGENPERLEDIKNESKKIMAKIAKEKRFFQTSSQHQYVSRKETLDKTHEALAVSEDK